jgi:hypothetical protein
VLIEYINLFSANACYLSTRYSLLSVSAMQLAISQCNTTCYQSVQYILLSVNVSMYDVIQLIISQCNTSCILAISQCNTACYPSMHYILLLMLCAFQVLSVNTVACQFVDKFGNCRCVM